MGSFWRAMSPELPRLGVRTDRSSGLVLMSLSLMSLLACVRAQGSIEKVSAGR